MKKQNVETLEEALRVLELLGFKGDAAELEEALARFGLDVVIPRVGGVVRAREMIAYGTEAIQGQEVDAGPTKEGKSLIVREPPRRVKRASLSRRDMIRGDHYDPEKHSDSKYDEPFNPEVHS